MSNRLPILAAEIRRAHADVQEAAKTAAEKAIEAGHALLEARKLVKHGEWLPWLREHCALADRTAQLYMQLPRKGAKSATVAHLGLNAAAQAVELKYGFHQPLYDGDEAERREWWLFVWFLRRHMGYRVESAVFHVDWIGRQNFKSPGEWCGPEGQKFVATWGGGFSEDFLAAWGSFHDDHRDCGIADLQAALDRLGEAEPSEPVIKRKRRRRT